MKLLLLFAVVALGAHGRYAVQTTPGKPIFIFYVFVKKRVQKAVNLNDSSRNCSDHVTYHVSNSIEGFANSIIWVQGISNFD